MATVAVVLLLCGALVGGLTLLGTALLGNDQTAQEPGRRAVAPAAPEQPQPSEQSGEIGQSPGTAPGEPLALPQPTGYEAGVPVGYPRSTPGVVAAAYGYSRVVTGLDVQATLATIEAIADADSGWFPAERTRIADGLLAQRKTLGIPPVGPPGQATVDVTPSGYQVLDQARDRATVLTLNVVSGRAADGTRTTGTLVFRWALRWDDERWRATATFFNERDAALAHTPLSSAAVAAGWKEATGG